MVILKETVTVIMMIYAKVKVFSSNGDIDFFSIVTGVRQGDLLTSYLFIIHQDDVLRMPLDLIKENGFALKKARS